jgi:predicted ribosome quality control (RQC) complex YloA/Tae2 family protein
MPIDAGMLSLLCYEINTATGARVDKIVSPDPHEIIISLHDAGVRRQLVINGGAQRPRIGFTETSRENPPTPPSFCQLLRKHISGAHLKAAYMPEFDRYAKLVFSARDEMGYPTEKSLYCEIMGKFSNVFLVYEGKILGVLRPRDLSPTSKRPLIVGAAYEPPPAQTEKISPLGCSVDKFIERAKNTPDAIAESFILSSFTGISPLIAREIAYRAGQLGIPVSRCRIGRLYDEFNALSENIINNRFTPSILKNVNGIPYDFSFAEITQYAGGICTPANNGWCAVEACFSTEVKKREKEKSAYDILKLLANTENRISKKIALQREELAECADAEKYKTKGDLITANLHVIKIGQSAASVTDYFDPDMKEITITLDPAKNPTQNAQNCYKKYTKSKSRREKLTILINTEQEELLYIESVKDALSRAQNSIEFTGIREELSAAGYGRHVNQGNKNGKNKKTSADDYAEYTSPSGYRVLCGKNNLQNDKITFKIASKGDLWFHVKNAPGSHVIMLCFGEEPPAEDYTFAAETAAKNSSVKSGVCDVDYTRVKNIKKPPGAKPGYVTYSTNYTATVVVS